METGERTCATCGRRMAPRARWARVADGVRYCSDGCRRTRPGPLDDALEAAILELLAARAGGATICPSEAARRIAPEDWRPLMERARRAARRLVAAGRVEILQGGRPVDPSTARGAIRLRALSAPAPPAAPTTRRR